MFKTCTEVLTVYFTEDSARIVDFAMNSTTEDLLNSLLPFESVIRERKVKNCVHFMIMVKNKQVRFLSMIASWSTIIGH